MTTIFSLPLELREMIYSHLELPCQVLCQINDKSEPRQDSSPDLSMRYEWSSRNGSDDEWYFLPKDQELAAIRTLYASMRTSKQFEKDLRLFIARTRKHIVQPHILSESSPKILACLLYVGDCEIMFTAAKRERDPLELMTWILSMLHFLPRVRKLKISVRHGSDCYHWSEVQPKLLPMALEAVDRHCAGLEEPELFFGGVWDYKGPRGVSQGKQRVDFMKREFLNVQLMKKRGIDVNGWKWISQEES